MFFKNLYFFAFTRPMTCSQESLENSLVDHAFTPCASTELSHFGFVPALGKGSTALAHESSGNILICARKEEKILPAAVIKDATDERIEWLEKEQGRKATKKEREQFKEDVIFSRLPQAFSRFTDTHAYINAELNLIVIDASSRGKAEDILALLRKALGTLPVTSFSPDTAPDETMTGWLSLSSAESAIGGAFSFGGRVELSAIGDNAATARLNNENLYGDEVQAHLNDGKYVNKIGLEYAGTVNFVLCDDLSIKQLKFEDVIKEQNDDIDREDHIALLTADFALMAGETNRMIIDLLGEFGVKTGDYLDQ